MSEVGNENLEPLLDPSLRDRPSRAAELDARRRKTDKPIEPKKVELSSEQEPAPQSSTTGNSEDLADINAPEMGNTLEEGRAKNRTEPKTETKASSRAETKPQVEAKASPRPETETKIEANAGSRTETKSETGVEVETCAETLTDIDGLSDAAFDAGPWDNAELGNKDAETEPESVEHPAGSWLAETKAEAAVAQAEAAIIQAEAQAEAQDLAEALAQALAEADAEAQALSEAKTLEEAEAQARADAKKQADAQAQAQADAKKQADAQAQAQAEAEALAAEKQAGVDALAKAQALAEAEAGEQNFSEQGANGESLGEPVPAGLRPRSWVERVNGKN